MMTKNNHNNIATCIHLSTFTRFIIPFGNFIGPLVLWMINKDKSQFINNHGKQAINFQISLLLYAFIISILFVPYFVFSYYNNSPYINFELIDSYQININSFSNVLGLGSLLAFLGIICLVLEFVFIIKASLSARDGTYYKYPFTIPFLK